MQRYEGASNTYGPHTLEAYQLIFTDLATAIATGAEVEDGPAPPDMRGFPDETLGPLVNDSTPDGATYGDVLEDALASYLPVSHNCIAGALDRSNRAIAALDRSKRLAVISISTRLY